MWLCARARVCVCVCVLGEVFLLSMFFEKEHDGCLQI